MPNALVVDDCAEMRQSLSLMLEEDGYCVVQAPDDKNALLECFKGDFDIVLCDIVIPEAYDGKDDEAEASGVVGLNTISTIHQYFPHIPIIAMSGYLVAEGLVTVKCLGASAILAKPFSSEELTEAISAAKKTASWLEEKGTLYQC